MKQEINIVDVIWDCREDRIENIEDMKPQFSKFLYSIKKCDGYVTFPTNIPFFPDNNKFTDMLRVLTGIISRVEELWVHVTKVQMRKSYWHGWLTTFITNKCLPQFSTRASNGYPFRMLYMRNIQRLIEKFVGLLSLINHDLIYIIYNN